MPTYVLKIPKTHRLDTDKEEIMVWELNTTYTIPHNSHETVFDRSVGPGKLGLNIEFILLHT